MKLLISSIALFLSSFSLNLFAACQASDLQYEQAIKRFWSIPEVKYWKDQLHGNHEKPVAKLNPELILIKEKCFYEITAYWDAGDHLHRWHFFQISQTGRAIYVDDLEGDFITLTKWRQTEDGKEWRSNSLSHARLRFNSQD